MSDYVTLYRLPFRHADRVRRIRGGECAECGQPARFQYGEFPDGQAVPFWYGGHFCSIGCFRAYNDLGRNA